MGQPRPFFIYFQKTILIFTTNKCEKCPSSIRYQDLNSQPLEHESPPITTRPGFLNVPFPAFSDMIFLILYHISSETIDFRYATRESTEV